MGWWGDDGVLIGMVGWEGELTAVLETEDGALARSHRGATRRAPSIRALLEATPHLCTGVGFDRTGLEAGERLMRAAADVGAGRMEALADVRDLAGTPAIVPRPDDVGVWAADALRRAADAARRGDPGCAVLVAEALAARPGTGSFYWGHAGSAPDPADGLRVPVPLKHPHLTQRVEVVPPPPSCGRTERPWVALETSVRRLERLIQLDFPQQVLLEEVGETEEALARLVAAVRGPAPQEPPRPPALRLARPEEGAGAWLFRVPYTHDPGVCLVGRAEHMALVTSDGTVRQTLPPCPHRPLYGSSRFVAFPGPYVFDVETGAWLDAWPDPPGIPTLPECWLPDDDGAGAHWVCDPRSGRTVVLDGPLLALHELGLLALTKKQCVRLSTGEPIPGRVRFGRRASHRLDVTTGDIVASRAPIERPEPPAACATAHFGQLLVATRAGLWVDGKGVLAFDGEVVDVSVHGGNGVGNGHLAVLTPQRLFMVDFAATADEDPTFERVGSVAL